MLTKYSYWH